MAAVLESIASQPDTFLASLETASDLRDIGSYLSPIDVEQYQVIVRNVIPGQVATMNLRLPPPPSVASVLAFGSNVLEVLDVSKQVRQAPNTNFKIVETLKVMLSQLPSLGDTTTAAIRTVVTTLVSPSVGINIGHLYHGNVSDAMMQAAPSVLGRAAMPLADMMSNFDEDVAHISLIDKDGLAVGLSTSMGTAFGSGIFLPTSGVLLNNGMGSFSLNTESSNVLDPGRRPLTFMCPLAVEDNTGKLVATLGCGGSPDSVSAMLQVLQNAFEFNMDLVEAVAYPRLHWMPSQVFAEPSVSQAILSFLTDVGNEVISQQNIGLVSGAVTNGRLVMAASDPRRNMTSTASGH